VVLNSLLSEHIMTNTCKTGEHFTNIEHSNICLFSFTKYLYWRIRFLVSACANGDIVTSLETGLCCLTLMARIFMKCMKNSNQ